MVLIPENFRSTLVFFNSRDAVSNRDVDVVPTDGDEVIGGYTRADVLFGLGGDDRIVGNGGADILAGDAGEDTLVGGSGADTLLGGDDDDYVDGGSGNDDILGGAGDDDLIGRGGRDEFDGGEGDDFIRGGGGFDQAHYGGAIIDDEGTFNFDFVRQGNSRGSITDLNPDNSDLGTDVLRSIESLKFDDFDISLNGGNNPVVAFDDDAETDEDNPVTFNVLDNDVEFDSDFLGLDDDIDIVSVDDSGLDGSVMFDAETGDITYDPGEAFQFLAFGEMATETLTYVVTDSRGATDTATVTITVIGVNDQPVTEDFAVAGGEDDEVISFDLSAFSSDVDLSDILSYQLFGPEEIFGSISIDPETGMGELVLGDDFQFLNAGETEVLEFQFVAIDDSGQPNDTSEPSILTITVNGADDATVSTADDFTFMSEDQSIFDTGSAFVLEPDLPFLGIDFSRNFNETLFEGDILFPSVAIAGGISLRAGLQPTFSLTSGDIDTTLTGSLAFEVPRQVVEGQEVTIESLFLLDDGSSFSTESPNSTFALDFVFDFAASLRAILDGNSFNVIPPIDIDFTRRLIDLSANDIGLTVPLPGGSSVSASFPVIETDGFITDPNSLTSTGQSDPVLSGTLDFDGLVTTILGLPPLEQTITLANLEILGFDAFSLDVFYNLLDLEFVANLAVLQNFELTIGDLAANIELENGDLIPFTVGDDITFTVPEDFDVNGNEILDFEVVLDVNGDENDDSIGALLDQLATLVFDLDFNLRALEFGVSATLLGFELDESIGPLVDINVPLIDSLAVADIFDDEFGLIGFNTDAGDFEIDASLLNQSGLTPFV
ncbi:MAG: Ig-like domain-containing protein [Pseudomonadota bacterium]